MSKNAFLIIFGICAIIGFVILIIHLVSKNKNTNSKTLKSTGEPQLQNLAPVTQSINLNPKPVPYNQPLPPDNLTIFGVSDQISLNKKMYTIMNLFSPVYNFHSDERFYPGTFDSCNNIAIQKL